MKNPRIVAVLAAATLAASGLLAAAPAQAAPSTGTGMPVDRIDPPERPAPPWEICPPRLAPSPATALVYCEIVVPRPPRPPRPPRVPGPDVPPPRPIPFPAAIPVAGPTDCINPRTGTGPYNPIPIWKEQMKEALA